MKGEYAEGPEAQENLEDESLVQVPKADIVREKIGQQEFYWRTFPDGG